MPVKGEDNEIGLAGVNSERCLREIRRKKNIEQIVGAVKPLDNDVMIGSGEKVRAGFPKLRPADHWGVP